VVEHPEYGEVIQLQGDKRDAIKNFLVEVGIAGSELVKVKCFLFFFSLVFFWHLL
jgi:translation initiation factor 1